MTKISIEFEASVNWSDSYQRNNKRDGLKHLRCFPFCDMPHKNSGFCGCPVRVRITREQARWPLEKLYGWSEFGRQDEEPRLKVGSIVSTTECENNTRSRKNPLRPWYQGYPIETENFSEQQGNVVEESKRVCVKGSKVGKESDENNEHLRQEEVMCMEFNGRKRGWNYSWAANKHTCDCFHVLWVYLLVEHGSEAYRCIGAFPSPAFSVYCRKRVEKGDNRSPRSSALSQMSVQKKKPAAVQSHEVFYNEHAPTTEDPAMIPADESSTESALSALLSSPEIDKGEWDGELSAEASEFRKFFIDSFWSENPSSNFDAFEQWEEAQGATGPYQEQPTPFTNEFRIDGHVEEKQSLKRNTRDAELSFEQYGGDQQEHQEGVTRSPIKVEQVPRAPPLQPLLKPEEAHEKTTHLGPTSEANRVLGLPQDNEEQTVNAMVWRLVLVFAMVEAHWTGVRHRGSSMASGYAGSLASAEHTLNVTDRAKQPSGSITSWEDYPTRASIDGSGSVVSGATFRRRFSSVGMSSKHQDIVRKLAGYLLEEDQFTSAISETLTALPKNTTMKEMKTAFVGVVHQQLGVFCEQENVTVHQFDCMFEVEPPLEFLKQAAQRLQMLQETMMKYSDVEKLSVQDTLLRDMKRFRQRSLTADNTLRLNLSGVWEMDEKLVKANHDLREYRGMPWVLRKMISYMETTFSVTQTGYDRVFMGIKRKLMSNGGNLYITDGRMRKFTLLSPLPWSRPLAESYRAWFENNVLYLEHYYSNVERLQRIISYEPYRLRVVLYFQEYDQFASCWTMVHQMEGYANLVTKGEGFNGEQFH